MKTVPAMRSCTESPDSSLEKDVVGALQRTESNRIERQPDRLVDQVLVDARCRPRVESLALGKGACVEPIEAGHEIQHDATAPAGDQILAAHVRSQRSIIDQAVVRDLHVLAVGDEDAANGIVRR
jgi:hypothetical protein